MFPEKTLDLANEVITALRDNDLMIVTAESCTGGLIAGALTAVPGSSSVVHGGFVTYANKAKAAMLGVPAGMIEDFGAVSEQVALAMATGARQVSETDISIAVTGVAGPGGGTKEKPVGLVHIGCSSANLSKHKEMRFGEIGREKIRIATIDAAFELVLDVLQN